MDWKKIGRLLLFPHIAVMLLLLPIASIFLAYSMICLGTESAGAIISYVVSAYTLTVWCIRMPSVIKFFKRFSNENRYVKRWRGDARVRINVSLFGTVLWNTAYALLQLGLGLTHHSFWFYSLACYYVLLALMRVFLVRYTVKNKPGERMKVELVVYRFCGCLFLVINLALSVMIFFMVYWNRSFQHHEITTIAIAAYTFTAFTMAIINIIKYRKYNSPVYSASKAVSLASACVSMLTLESTMLTTFDDGNLSLVGRKILLGCTGGAVSIFIILMAIYMISESKKRLKNLKITGGE